MDERPVQLARGDDGEKGGRLNVSVRIEAAVREIQTSEGEPIKS